MKTDPRWTALGVLGDLIGSKRVFIAGLTLFTLASLLCGMSWFRDMLVGIGMGVSFPSLMMFAMQTATARV